MAVITGDQAVAADVLALLATKLKSETRVLTAATGDVAYTGYGFKPRALIIFAGKGAGNIASWGMGDENLAEMCLYTTPVGGLATFYGDATKIVIIDQDSGTNLQTAILKTLDADGFTLTWTKTAAPTGTCTMVVLAINHTT